ncbi:UbiX family flavin prenyltransferase [Acinetobacter baumannii]|uniref:UbiX family flavin prenyltransferase n=1 Tax=Acinetobacter baumannii TaxID=470 RepID=UPI0034DDD15F
MKRIVVCITGATGVIYGIRLLEKLAELNIETHLVISKWAKVTLKQETNYSLKDLEKIATYIYSDADQSAPISSGSFRYDGVVIAPCSMKTLAGIRMGFAENLIIRTADVALKERRRLVLMVRETPLSVIHLENMLGVAKAGAIIFPAMPAFYHQPYTLDDVINQGVGRILDMFDIDDPSLKRWEGLENKQMIKHKEIKS